MNTSDIRLRIVIPAHNEAENLPQLCERIAITLDKVSYRLYIVDDGSSDGTATVLGDLGKRYPIRPLRHRTNLGIAAVFLTGMRAALEGAEPDDAIVVMEGDGTNDPAILPDMLETMAGQCDVVIASRYAAGGAYRSFPPKRLFLSTAANTLLSWICRVPGARDYTSFYRMYRAGPLRRAVEAHGDNFTSVGGLACNAEMLLRLAPFVREVHEVAFIYDYALKRGARAMRLGPNLQPYLALFKIHFSK